MKKTKEKVAVATNPKWEVKDRRYFLKNGRSPLSYIMKSQGLFYFDEEKGYEREVAYAENQNTPFVDEFKGQVRLSHIIFRDGELVVPKNKVALQKFLSIYHPEKDTTYEEWNPIKEANEDLVDIEMEIKALNAAKDLDIDHAEAILRVEVGSEVASMSSKEIKRDILIMAKNNPELFLELVHK